MYKVTYIPGQAFVLHLPGYDLEFIRQGKLYIADYKELPGARAGSNHICATITKNESVYTYTEICKTKEAYEFLKNSGNPSPD
jgi:hypothetical protein